MPKLFIKILALLILTSFSVETAVQVFKNSKTELAALVEPGDSEKKSGEEKSEKETEKDKINFSFRHLMFKELSYSHCNHLNAIITSAYLSLPEIPPDQA